MFSPNAVNKKLVEDYGLFKLNLEFRKSGVTWKMKYQLVLETGN
jgi:hypothetical protein